MSDRNTAHHDTAIQYLAWAVEEIEKSGNEEAARHARAALKCLKKARPSRPSEPLSDTRSKDISPPSEPIGDGRNSSGQHD
jgi:hypothetical protein